MQRDSEWEDESNEECDDVREDAAEDSVSSVLWNHPRPSPEAKDMEYELTMTDEEFGRAMELVDRDLSAENFPIPMREIRGWILFCGLYGLEGIAMSHPISQRVMDWFKAKYGDRLNLDLDLGDSLVLVDSDLLRFRCPLFYGRLVMFCAPDLIGRTFPEMNVRRPALSNALALLRGVTKVYAKSLGESKLRQILNSIASAHIRLARIGDVRSGEFLPEARADLRASVEHMTSPQPQYGLSKWASAQAVEKFLKSYLSERGGKIGRHHNLGEYVKSAELLGLRATRLDSISKVQCSPEARYNSTSVTRSEAVAAHEEALLICSAIALQLTGQSGWRTGVLGRHPVELDGVVRPDTPAITLARTKD